MMEFIKNLETNQLIVYAVIILLILIQLSASILKSKIKTKFKREKRKIEEFGEIEKVSMAYYKQYQWIDIKRFSASILFM